MVVQADAALLELVVWSLALCGVVSVGILALPWGDEPGRAAARSLALAGRAVARWVAVDPVGLLSGSVARSYASAGRGRVTT